MDATRKNLIATWNHTTNINSRLILAQLFYPLPKHPLTSSNGILQSRLSISITLSTITLSDELLLRRAISTRPTRLDLNAVIHSKQMTISNSFRIPGAIRPYYIHTPTCYVYESPMLTGMPLGLYSMQTGILNLYGQQNQYSNGFGTGYQSMPVETPYSATALALQRGRYPATTMAVTNSMAYPSYGSPYSSSMYGTYGQRGIMPGLIM